MPWGKCCLVSPISLSSEFPVFLSFSLQHTLPFSSLHLFRFLRFLSWILHPIPCHIVYMCNFKDSVTCTSMVACSRETFTVPRGSWWAWRSHRSKGLKQVDSLSLSPNAGCGSGCLCFSSPFSHLWANTLASRDNSFFSIAFRLSHSTTRLPLVCRWSPSISVSKADWRGTYWGHLTWKRSSLPGVGKRLPACPDFVSVAIKYNLGMKPAHLKWSRMAHPSAP